ncbi:975_t:CDS:2, partial [Racocetra persica]
RPFSLFKDSSMLSRGIVGIAFTSMTSTSTIKKQIQVNHQALCSIGEPLKITRCQGNIILELDGLNPTNLLLKRFQYGNIDQTMSKETEYYLGIYDIENKLDESMLIVNKILSGDPVRGNMAIDTTKNLKNGQFVKFMYRKNYSTIEPIPKIFNHNGINIVLETSDREEMDFPSSPPTLNKTIIERNIFGGISENGIIIGRGAINENQIDTSWVCNVPYSFASLSF